MTVTSLYSHWHHTRTRLLSLLDCQRPLFPANVPSFKSLPIQPLLPIAIGSWTYVDRPSVTDTNKPKKQIHKKTFGYNTVQGMSVMRFWTDNCRPMQPAFAKLQEQWRQNVRNEETTECRHGYNSWKIKDQLDVTSCFISLVCSTCFGH